MPQCPVIEKDQKDVHPPPPPKKKKHQAGKNAAGTRLSSASLPGRFVVQPLCSRRQELFSKPCAPCPLNASSTRRRSRVHLPAPGDRRASISAPTAWRQYGRRSRRHELAEFSLTHIGRGFKQPSAEQALQMWAGAVRASARTTSCTIIRRGRVLSPRFVGDGCYFFWGPGDLQITLPCGRWRSV